MAYALQELDARIANLRSDAKFLSSALTLRPYVGSVVDWQNGEQNKLQIVKGFAACRDYEAARFYGPLLVRLIAEFERFLRTLIQEIVQAWAKKAKKFESLPDG